MGDLPQETLNLLGGELHDFLKGHKKVQVSAVLRTGEHIGDWQVLGMLSRGGCGEVYRVVHTRTGEIAALKVPHKDDEVLRARFVLEADVLQRMDASVRRGIAAFPHFLERGTAREGTCPYVVIEELKDFTLPDTDAAVAAFLLKMCTAMAELHANGYLHRDLKPANIMCRADGEPVIIDFGLAMRISNPQQLPLAERVSLIGGLLKGVGTIGSSAPEQAAGEATIRSDVYSLGALAKDCFRGNPPPAWGPIILRALDPKPEYRYASPAAFAEAIRRRSQIDVGKWVRRVALNLVILAGMCGGVWFGGTFVQGRWGQTKRPSQISPVREVADSPETERLLAEGWDQLFGLNGKARNLVTAADCFRQAAEAGSVRGRIELGKCYLGGQGVTKDAAAAYQIFEAESANASLAQCLLGTCQLYGWGTVQNPQMAADNFRQASARGCALATYYLAQCYRQGRGVHGDVQEADRLLLEAATNGCILAQVDWVESKNGTEEAREQMLERATRTRVTSDGERTAMVRAWLARADRAQEIPDVEHCCQQALAYGEKAGLAPFALAIAVAGKDPARAERLYEESFQAGHGEACLNLVMLCAAAGESKMLELEHWCRTADKKYRTIAEAGNRDACLLLGQVLLANERDADGVARGLDYLERAGDLGDVRGYVIAANALYLGEGVSVDLPRAGGLYMKAAKQGYPIAMHNLGMCYLKGVLPSGENPKKAFEWFTRADEVDYDLAAYSLGECYQYGLGVEKDEAKAVMFFEKGITNGILNAKTALADILLTRDSRCYDAPRGIALLREVVNTTLERDERKDEYSDDSVFACVQGEAAYLLGRAYWRGDGVEVDRVRAREWFKKSSETSREGKAACQALADGNEPSLEGLRCLW